MTGAKSLSGLNVLVVEDDAATRAAIVTLLRTAGVSVRDAASADAAFALFRDSRPDVVVSDIGLPGEDGYVLIRHIRNHERTEDAAPVPALALTAFARDIDRRLAIEPGYQKHIGKPIDPEQLLAALREIAPAR